MGLLDKLLGRDEPQPQTGISQGYNGAAPNGASSADQQALARYRYMLQTAPPEDIEQAHAEAFARLTPEQRRLALQQMSGLIPAAEQAQLSDDPQSLARAATRQEMRQPGSLQQAFGGGGMGGGMMAGAGAMMAGGLLSSLAGAFIGSSIAHSFFSNPANEQSFQQNDGESNADNTGGQDLNDQNAGDPYGDPSQTGETVGYESTDTGGFDGGGDFGGGDFGGDF